MTIRDFAGGIIEGDPQQPSRAPMGSAHVIDEVPERG
jgi:hypothetical protein